MSNPKRKLNIDTDSLKKIKLVAVAYSHVDEEFFPNKEAFEAEKEVEERAQQVMEECKKLGLESKGYPADPYFLTNILVDRPDVIVNLVDTVRGKDKLASTIPAFLEYANIPYTGCDTTGMVIGNWKEGIQKGRAAVFRGDPARCFLPWRSKNAVLLLSR